MWTLFTFYRSKEWKELLKTLKMERVNREGYIICEHCGKPILKAYDCIGHHKEELTEENVNDVSISLNPNNIALVHHRCHNKMHNKLGYSHRQVFIVYGSPLAGKNSWVAENAESGDLIVDMDAIWRCVSGCDKYTKPNRLKSVVFGTRDYLIDCVKYRRGKWLNAYIIGGYPYQMDREKLAERLGAREVFIDTSKDECIKRLYNCNDGRNVDEWLHYIEDWWLQFNGGY